MTRRARDCHSKGERPLRGHFGIRAGVSVVAAYQKPLSDSGRPFAGADHEAMGLRIGERGNKEKEKVFALGSCRLYCRAAVCL